MHKTKVWESVLTK